MLFYIAPSVATGVEILDSETVDFVLRLLDSRKRGLLLIHASRKTYSRIIDALRAQHRHPESNLLERIAHRQREVKGLARELSKLVYVSRLTARLQTIKSKFIVVSPALINQTNYLYYPVVLAENVSDSILYLNRIAETYVASLAPPLRTVSLRGRRRMGGGNTTHVQYTEIKNEGLELCLCIVDSDRRCPGENIGETADLVVKADIINPAASCAHIVIDVCAAENLLPLEEIKRIYSEGKSADQMLQFERLVEIRKDEAWRYLPLKKGLTSNTVRANKAYSVYWRKTLDKLNILKCCNNEQCNCILVPALNSKTLAEAVKEDNSTWLPQLKVEINSDVRAVYERISLELRSWCCVGAEMRA